MSIWMAIPIVILTVLVLDRVGLWMERQGWIYYRKIKSKGGGLGNALQEFNAFLNPSTKHAVEVKQKDSKQRDDQGDGHHPP